MRGPTITTNAALTRGLGVSYGCHRTPLGRSEDTTRRRQAFVLVAAVSLALWPGRAWADAPERTLFESEDGLVPAGACLFPVFIHVVAINEYRIEFSDDAGNLIRTIIQGRAVLEFTNTDTGTSVIRNVSGPATITEADQIAVKTGPWLFIFFPGDLGTGTPGTMFINYGRVVEYRGEPHKIISQTGVQEDLCATLGESPDAEASGADASGCPDGEASGAAASESKVRPQGPPDAHPEGVDFPDDLRPGSPGSLLISRERNSEFLGEAEVPSRITSQTGVQEDLCATLDASPESEATDMEATAGDESQIPLERVA
jgi:uncharacterized protein YndB with AHSA1/START domain